MLWRRRQDRLCRRLNSKTRGFCCKGSLFSEEILRFPVFESRIPGACQDVLFHQRKGLMQLCLGLLVPLQQLVAPQAPWLFLLCLTLPPSQSDLVWRG